MSTHKNWEGDFWGQFGVVRGLVKVGVNDVLTANLGLGNLALWQHLQRPKIQL